uniref:Uncharacterized protein n=1 Tax=Salix viminalis TaxID=40686 RepID=A0A6N2K674_SALVM
MGFLLKFQIRFAQYQLHICSSVLVWGYRAEKMASGLCEINYCEVIYETCLDSDAGFYVNVSSGVGLKYSSSV